MRTLRKRLVVVNRSNCEKNNDAINKVQDRYIEKMSKRGWELFKNGNTKNGFTTQGNAMFAYERYITIVKYNSKEESLRLSNLQECKEVFGE